MFRCLASTTMSMCLWSGARAKTSTEVLGIRLRSFFEDGEEVASGNTMSKDGNAPEGEPTLSSYLTHQRRVTNKCKCCVTKTQNKYISKCSSLFIDGPARCTVFRKGAGREISESMTSHGRPVQIMQGQTCVGIVKEKVRLHGRATWRATLPRNRHLCCIV